MIDLVFVTKDAKGDVVGIELSDMDEAVSAAFQPHVQEPSGLLSDEDIADLGDDLEPESSAAILLFEHVWATKFRDALVGSGGELIGSIREKGVLESILVRSVGGRFQIIAGERRYRAAIEAGLVELPCVIRDTSDAEMMELALVENLQRKDLTPFEEADGLRVLAERYGYTHEEMAEKLGKSRSSITESLSLTAMPEEVRQLCRLADIQSKSVLLQIVRQGTSEKMTGLIERLQEAGTTRAEVRRLSRKPEVRVAGRGTSSSSSVRAGATSHWPCTSSGRRSSGRRSSRRCSPSLDSLRRSS